MKRLLTLCHTNGSASDAFSFLPQSVTAAYSRSGQSARPSHNCVASGGVHQRARNRRAQGERVRLPHLRTRSERSRSGPARRRVRHCQRLLDQLLRQQHGPNPQCDIECRDANNAFRAASRRAAMSVEPPGAKGTTSVTERSGKRVRHAGAVARSRSNPRRVTTRSISRWREGNMPVQRRTRQMFGSARPALTCGASRGWMRVVPVL
jgi:hypothetical protein